ncbi:hypothetical protein [Microbacterium sp. NPDC087592]|uniref:hypothetical protein n=1 Tax=Microbacterium sp. NPDC087592 TaxID=3364193 RepID=UPI0037FBAA5B
MGGLVIETIRPGVQFTPDAAAAFRRAEAQVLAEFGRRIDVNSTYRSWSDQMVMYIDWTRYVASGYKPSLKPDHSKAVHPSQSFHVSGTALDSDDWRNARIVAILAENGFIRNRLSVPDEQHHFEYIRARDENHGKPASGGGQSEEDDMTPEQDKKLNSLFDAMFNGGNSMKDGKKSISQSLAEIHEKVGPIYRSGGSVTSVRQELANINSKVTNLQATQSGLEAALTALANAKGLDASAILKAAQQGVENALRKVTFSADVDE